MPSRILRRSGRSQQQGYRMTEPSREVQSIENKAHAAAIAAQLRAQIPCSTDPAWLENMAREVENRASRPQPQRNRSDCANSNRLGATAPDGLPAGVFAQLVD
jgi:hypothetical protein